MQLLDGEPSGSKKHLNKTYKGISNKSSTILRDEQLPLINYSLQCLKVWNLFTGIKKNATDMSVIIKQ